MDVLADLLSVTRLRRDAHRPGGARATMGLEVNPIAESNMHVVQRGSCWLLTTARGTSPRPGRSCAGCRGRWCRRGKLDDFSYSLRRARPAGPFLRRFSGRELVNARQLRTQVASALAVLIPGGETSAKPVIGRL